MPKVTFDNSDKSFFKLINTHVEDYFTKNDIKKTGNARLYIKSGILIAVAILTYGILLSIHLHPAIAVLLCVILGVAQAGIGFNVMHDANHGSFSEKKWVNNIMSLTSNMMGVNSWLWRQKHNIIHHTYTNIDGVDDDIAESPLLRMCASHKQLKIHRYQNIYCTALYSIMSFWMFITDFTKYFTGKIHGTSISRMKTREHIIFWVSKLLYVFFFIGLPAMLVGIVPAIAGFAIMQATLGLCLAFVFQLAHMVESTHFIDATDKTHLHIEDEWAMHQVQTTANFATNNKIVTWFTGGLNYQVEHHLFPKISHVHYPAINKFVKDACESFSVRYNNYPSMLDALQSHFRFMKKLGVE